MEFEYLKDYKEKISIEDIFNCSITAVNDDGEEWYLHTSTNNEVTDIKTFGPLKVDVNLIPEYFQYNSIRVTEEEELILVIKGFIEDDSKKITEVIELTEEQYIQRWNEISDKL